MPGSGEKTDSCFFQKKSFFSALAYAQVLHACLLATCYPYRTGTIQLMEIPEVMSSQLALVPTILIPALAKDHVFLSHQELQLVGRVKAVIFKLLFLRTKQFSGDVWRLKLTSCPLVSFVTLCRSCNQRKSIRGEGTHCEP